MARSTPVPEYEADAGGLTELCSRALSACAPVRGSALLKTPAAFSIGAPFFAQLLERCWLESAVWEVQNRVAPLQELCQAIARFGRFGLGVVRVHLIADPVVGDARLPPVGGCNVQHSDVAVVLTRWPALLPLGFHPVLAQLVRRDELAAQLPRRSRSQRSLGEVQDRFVTEHE